MEENDYLLPRPQTQDKSGRFAASGRYGGGTSENHAQSQNREKQYAKYLVRAAFGYYQKQKFEMLYLVAPAKFLTLLRAELHPYLKKHLAETIDADIVKFRPHEILDHVLPPAEA